MAKNSQAYGTSKNGVIYKDHPLVTKVRLLYQDYLTMDVEKSNQLYRKHVIYNVMNSE